MSKTKNKNLHRAKKAKNDEFYTLLPDIEREIKHYKEHFQGKVVFLNCDDPEESNFWQYFVLNFEFLGLKKLISTHYEEDKPSYKLEVMADINGDGKINGLDTIKTPLKQNGDFRSPECIEILKEADVVVTNPPFSLFREYVAQLVEYKKKFLIIGNMNAITYKETFKLIKDGKIWAGYNFNKTMEFQLPDHYEKWSRVDDAGNKYGKVPAICWFTNLPHKKRNEEIVLYRTYNEADYPTYDNYDAIEVNRVKNIPMDYDGAMGVPITFLGSFNPQQFEIVSSNDYRTNDKVPFKEHGLIKDKDSAINGKPTYVRIVIRKKK